MAGEHRVHAVVLKLNSFYLLLRQSTPASQSGAAAAGTAAGTAGGNYR